MAAPRWARKLDAEAHPAPSIQGEYQVLKLVLAAAVLCFPAGMAVGRGVSWLIPDRMPALVTIVVAVASLLVLAPLFLVVIKQWLGVGPLTRSVLPVVTFFGVVSAVLLMDIAR